MPTNDTAAPDFTVYACGKHYYTTHTQGCLRIRVTKGKNRIGYDRIFSVPAHLLGIPTPPQDLPEVLFVIHAHIRRRCRLNETPKKRNIHLLLHLKQ